MAGENRKHALWVSSWKCVGAFSCPGPAVYVPVHHPSCLNTGRNKRNNYRCLLCQESEQTIMIGMVVMFVCTLGLFLFLIWLFIYLLSFDFSSVGWKFKLNRSSTRSGAFSPSLPHASIPHRSWLSLGDLSVLTVFACWSQITLPSSLGRMDLSIWVTKYMPPSRCTLWCEVCKLPRRINKCANPGRFSWAGLIVA